MGFPWRNSGGFGSFGHKREAGLDGRSSLVERAGPARNLGINGGSWHVTRSMEQGHGAVPRRAREKRGERVALLDSVSSDDPWLRPIVEQMLRDHEAAGSFLNESPLQFFAANASSGAAAAGQRFGRYELVAPLERGGMGEVWAANDMELERRVALKFLAPEAALGRAVERLRREARTISALNHPNIVTVHEVIPREEAPIIVLELVDGNSLREICSTPQPFPKLIQIAFQIAQALAAAHAHGIVHRDVKPENILLRRDGYVKVLDFGLARHFEAATLPASGTLPGATLPGGTLRYMSPEQARSEPLTPATGIFSFGLVLYELVTGRHAFPRDSASETVRAILTNEPVAPPSVNPLIPRQLDSLILSMLAHRPSARPSAEHVAHRLSEFQRSLEMPAIPEKRLARRGMLIAALLLLALSSAATWLWRYHAAGKKPPVFYQVTTFAPESRATAQSLKTGNGRLIPTSMAFSSVRTRIVSRAPCVLLRISLWMGWHGSRIARSYWRADFPFLQTFLPSGPLAYRRAAAPASHTGRRRHTLAGRNAYRIH